MQDIITKARISYQARKPFVLFANSNSSTLNAYFQKDDTLVSFEGQEGFVFVSFNKEHRYIIPKTNSIFLSEEIQYYNSNLGVFEKDSFKIKHKKDFENLVSKGIHAIKNLYFSKVVLSRRVSLHFKIDFEASYLNMLNTYKSAFRYLFYHPKIGMWMGASPEQLINIDDNILYTVALAGTQVYKEDLFWENKEKQEQQFVTDYIVSEIQPFAEKVMVSEPFTVQAGNLAHIKTTIEANLLNSCNSLEIVKKMHPTPAVCGLPKEPAYNFIIQNENYDRKFYTGYLGEWNTKNKNLFVNLRCIEIEEDNLHFYVGCGITKDSVPEKEFFETENKLETMSKIIKLKV
ncbi:Isochorismate synthase [Flavobacterium sp. 9AF]|uniref:chorismate-binding protein n=1 Tax=Flavobacterium sp. 9AF TaxID=2653142 RepID=UPI0012EFBB48|nr:chorismate-binding protein [Flavobacterium sp. 9AF]VXB87795.1 Isochorismate synthase [Flavobacterium sp. 9AF]